MTQQPNMRLETDRRVRFKGSRRFVRLAGPTVRSLTRSAAGRAPAAQPQGR